MLKSWFYFCTSAFNNTFSQKYYQAQFADFDLNKNVLIKNYFLLITMMKGTIQS